MGMALRLVRLLVLATIVTTAAASGTSYHTKNWRSWYAYSIPSAGEYEVQLFGKSCKNSYLNMVVLKGAGTAVTEDLEESAEFYMSPQYPDGGASTTPFGQWNSGYTTINAQAATGTVSTADAHAGHSHRRGGRRSAGHSANAFPVVLDFPAGTYPQTWFFFSDADLVGDFEMVVKKEGTTTAIASSSKEVHADPNKCSAAATTTASCDCDDDKYMWAGLILAIGLVGMFPIFFKQCATSAMAMYILGLFNCFGGGALLGVAVGHVFPEAIDLYPPSKSDDYPAAAMLVATGYIALLVCDKLFLALCGPEDECQEEPAAPPLEKSGKDADETTVGVAPASSAPMVDLSSESAPASAQGSGSGCNGLDDPNATAVPATLTQAIGVFIGMALHSVMAGLTLGLKTDKTSMENLGIAIVCHKLFDVTA